VAVRRPCQAAKEICIVNKLFGLSMNTIMAVLIGIVVVALLAFVYAAARSPVLFKLGLRNIPRRRAQTIIIVLGLMVSTLIIASAFTVGDSLSYSITKVVYDTNGPVDIAVNARAVGSAATQGSAYIPDTTIAAIEQQVGNDTNLLAWIPVADEPVPATNTRNQTVEPQVHLFGIDAAGLQTVGGLPPVSGKPVQLAALKPGEAYLNASAAGKLSARTGDTIRVMFNNQPATVTVAAIVQDRWLSGYQGAQRTDNGGIVMSIDGVRAITGRSGATSLLASSSANTRAGAGKAVKLFPAVKQAVESDQVQGPLNGTGVALKASNSKHDYLELAQTIGNFQTTFFLIIGLFSIAAGIMLIFLIFVMLAAERRPEMGMARAVGIKRAGLVQAFLAEGMVYNLLAGMVGAALGVVVAYGLVWFATHAVFTGKFALPISTHVSARSLVVSYCLGVALTFVTVVISAYRTTRMNIVAAIRDMPEDSAGSAPRRIRGKLIASSLARIVGSAAVSVALSTAAKAGVTALAAGVVGLVLLVAACLPVTRSIWGVIWRTVAGAIAGVPWGLLGLLRAFGMGWAAVWSVVCVIAGVLSLVPSHSAKSVFLFTAGVSLTLLGLALIARVRHLPTRMAFSTLGIVLLVFWLLPTNLFRDLFGDLYGRDSGGIEMAFLSGIMLVLATTLILVFNGELLARAVNRAGGRLGSIRPALATAIAYPMASRFRTGITLAMFSLIIFSLTLMSTLNANFTRLFLTNDATGGWDVSVVRNQNNALGDGDPKSVLQGKGIDTSKYAVVGATSGFNGLDAVRMAGDTSWKRYFVRAADPSFLNASTEKLQAHLPNQRTEDAWKELQRQPGTAIIDARALPGNGNPGSSDDEPNFQLSGIKANAKILDQPLQIEVQDATGAARPIKVIGVINQVVEQTNFTIFTSAETYKQTLGADPVYLRYLVRLAPGASDTAVVQDIRRNLAAVGVDATAIRSDLADQQQQNKGFSYLMQGFMALGLVVGIAAVAVVAARTVVERRQQIGMLRAVGYRRSQVALSFALETSFIALFGIAAGVITASILSYNLFTGNTFGDTGASGFALPYGQILLFAGVSYVASLAITYFPSHKAASLPIAEALRYE